MNFGIWQLRGVEGHNVGMQRSIRDRTPVIEVFCDCGNFQTVWYPDETAAQIQTRFNRHLGN